MDDFSFLEKLEHPEKAIITAINFNILIQCNAAKNSGQPFYKSTRKKRKAD